MINENIFKMNQPTIISNPGQSFSAHDLMRFCDALKEWKITPTLFFFHVTEGGKSKRLFWSTDGALCGQHPPERNRSALHLLLSNHSARSCSQRKYIVYKVQGLNEIFPQLVLQLPISLRSLLLNFCNLGHSITVMLISWAKPQREMLHVHTLK